jgi:hypothetical protein
VKSHRVPGPSQYQIVFGVMFLERLKIKEPEYYSCPTCSACI